MIQFSKDPHQVRSRVVPCVVLGLLGHSRGHGVLVCSAWLLDGFGLVLVHVLLVDHPQRGEKVAHEDHQEGGTAHQDLPLLPLWELCHSEESHSIIELEEMTKEQKGQQEGQTSPHPRLEALYC